MKEKALHVLLVEDNAGDARITERYIARTPKSAANPKLIVPPVTETKMEHCVSFELEKTICALNG